MQKLLRLLENSENFFRTESDFSESTVLEAEEINELLRNKDVLLLMCFNIDVQVSGSYQLVEGIRLLL